MWNQFTKSVYTPSNPQKTMWKIIATLLAKMLRKRADKAMNVKIARRPHREPTRLYGPVGRKYLNRGERHRFLGAIGQATPRVRLFCLVLIWSGCRVSEALALTPANIDLESCVVEFTTLKRRRSGIVRQVPLPPQVISELNGAFDLTAAQRDPTLATRRLWSWSRSTAWRHVKDLMVSAEVCGTAAMPKGLRHTFGVAAFYVVPPHLVQRWLGHASLRTTAIYGDVIGPEEQEFAERVWRGW